jgi:F-type H+-transporting ATPase subunit b
MILLDGGIDFGPLLPEHPEELYVGLVLLVVIFLVIWKFVVPVFEQTYAERTAEITGGIEKAEAAQAEAAQALAAYQAQLADARSEAARIREEAKAEAATTAAEIRAQAQADADRIVATAKAQLEAERSQVVAQLRGEIGGLATELAGRIVGESLADADLARRTVDRFLADLEAQPVEQA